MSKILITGAAGFIGYHLAKRLCKQGHDVIGIDNLNAYYDVQLKLARLDELKPFQNFSFIKIDITDREMISNLFAKNKIDTVVNLAAQAGVRHSLENPTAYIDSNTVGFGNILEACRQSRIKHLVYASSSSVYSGNKKYPFSENDSTDHPISLYAATKKSNELMAHTYSHLYNLACTGLRFFTVYGPWGRPDMALFKFTKNILENKPIDVYNNGDMSRDFTYIDDAVETIIRVIDKIPEKNSLSRIYNIGAGNPTHLMAFIEELEKNLGGKAEKNYLPMQAGDLKETFANMNAFKNDFGFSAKTPITTGIARFVAWYQQQYHLIDQHK